MIARRLRKIILAGFAALSLLSSTAASFAQLPPPIPALPDVERRTAYSITASTCNCTVNFALFGDSTDFSNWVEVYLNGVRVNFNDGVFGWKITSPTGSLATIPRPITDAVLTFNTAQTGTVQIVGARRPRRTSQFNENTGIPARNVNQVITDITATLREMWDKTNDMTGRGVFAPPGETMNILPPMASRASMSACFDSGGNLTSCVSVSSSTFVAGSGIVFTGTNPTTISANIPLGTAATQNIGTSGATAPLNNGANTFNVANLAGVATPLRIPVAVGTTLYVNPFGVPTTCGVTGALTCGVGSPNPTNPTNPATPFDTVNNAINYIASNLDARANNIIINLSHGNSTSYAFNCFQQPLLGTVTFSVVGDYTSPGSVGLVAPNGGFGVNVRDQCVPSLSSFGFVDQGSSLGYVNVDQQGICDLRSMVVTGLNASVAAFSASDGGIINFVGTDPNSTAPNTIIAGSYGSILVSQFGGIINFNGTTVTIPTAIAFSHPFAVVNGAYIKGISGSTFTGAGVPGTAGTRCSFNNAYTSGVNPNTTFPGNANCTPTTTAF
jgi:hypothetical protein